MKMFGSFKYDSVPLKDIALDERNPRIVSLTRLSSQNEILEYLYEHEHLEAFIRKIASEGKNLGAERPYVIKSDPGFIVVEGNTRIAAYKVLAGLLKPPQEYANSVPHISNEAKNSLLNIDCSIAPNRDALMPIMASAHFGMGDKSKWGYLGSRKAVYDEWKLGKSLAKLAKLFNVTQGDIKELIFEYQLYLKAIGLTWTRKEKDILLKPSVAFNPPVRFLQTSGHKEKIGIALDGANLKIKFAKNAEKKFKHLIKKLVINPQKGLGATASYDAVFADYLSPSDKNGTAGSASNRGGRSAIGTAGNTTKKTPKSTRLGPDALFSYSTTINNGLIKQLMIEAKDINSKKFPAAATFLLRNIVEAILKHIVEEQKANRSGKTLDLESCLNMCASDQVKLPATDRKVLGEFKKHHLQYLNLGAHGNLIPNRDRVLGARDTIDQFVKKYV